MTKKQKEAVKTLQFLFRHIGFRRPGNEFLINGEWKEIDIDEIETFHTILSLIDEQQKEIKRLEKSNKDLVKTITDKIVEKVKDKMLVEANEIIEEMAKKMFYEDNRNVKLQNFKDYYEIISYFRERVEIREIKNERK